MIDTRIETFLKLCSFMNYRKTAELLNMTQPAVTQHIHYLEKLYGCKLFVYDRKTLTMTENAVRLKEFAENILYQEQKLKTSLSHSSGHRLSIGATKTIGEYVIAGQIENYLRDTSNQLSVTVDNTKQLLHLVSDGSIDFALIEGFFDRRRYAAKLYKQEEFVGICGASHPFAGKTLPLDAVFNETVFLREEGSGTRTIAEQLMLSHNHSFSECKRTAAISNFGLMMRLIEAGAGITFAYRSVMANSKNLSAFQVKGFTVTHEFNYVFLDTPFSRQAVDYFDTFQSAIP